MVTTPVAILSRVWAQFAGEPGMPDAGIPGTEPGVVAVRAAVADEALNAGVTDKANKEKSSEMRDMPILGAFNGQVK
jgi:hypothetical protein